MTGKRKGFGNFASMILRLYRLYKTGKTLYTKVLKPVYEELRKDAYALDAADKRARNRKSKSKKNDAVHQKPKRGRKRQPDTKGL